MVDENMIVAMRIKNARNEQEYEWANKVGVKAYRTVTHKIANLWWTKLYNWIWNRIDRPKNGEWYPDKHPNYEKLYYKGLNLFVKPVIALYGGYDWKTKRKVTVNFGYFIVPVEEDYVGKATHYFEDFIDVKDFGR